MDPYPHIDTIYKRDMADRGRLLEGEYSQDSFAYLADNAWIGTEKVDGTNLRVQFTPQASLLSGVEQALTFQGKTDNAQIPPFLLARLDELFRDPRMLDRLQVQFTAPVCLYGEGYGARIQKGGGNYIPDGVDFVLFDVKIGQRWLKREAVEEIARNLGIKVVPIVFEGGLHEAVDMTCAGFVSTWGDFPAEGLVLVPKVPLLDRNGDRIITKIKHVDFRHTNRGQGQGQ